MRSAAAAAHGANASEPASNPASRYRWALAPRPRLLLLDEPFSSLDGATVQRLLVEMRAILQQARQTALLVTHSLHEAQTLADQVFAMSEGGSLAPRRA